MRLIKLPLSIAGSALLFAGCLESTPATGDVLQPDAPTADAVADGTVDITVDTVADGQDAETDTACWDPPDPSALAGQSCEPEYDQKAFCDGNSEVIVGCAGGTWLAGSSLASDPSLPCGCWSATPVDCGPQDFGCAVIGYAGISVAGFARVGGARLRLV